MAQKSSLPELQGIKHSQRHGDRECTQGTLSEENVAFSLTCCQSASPPVPVSPDWLLASAVLVPFCYIRIQSRVKYYHCCPLLMVVKGSHSLKCDILHLFLYVSFFNNSLFPAWRFKMTSNHINYDVIQASERGIPN